MGNDKQKNFVIENSVDWSPDLFEEFRTIPGFTQEITVDEASSLTIQGHIDAMHRGVYGTSGKAVMVAFRVKINGEWFGAKTGGNIVGVEQHYLSSQIYAYKRLAPGTYIIELHGRSASTAAPGKNGLAEVRGGYNYVTYTVTANT